MDDWNVPTEERNQRQAVILEAMSWIGTPYHLNACIKRVGVDCGTLLIACFNGAGFIPATDLGTFTPWFHLHRGDEVYQEWLTRFCRRVSEPLPGDIALFRFGRIFCHGGLIIRDDIIVHAHDSGVVEEDTTTGRFAGRERQFWSFWGHL
jgi:cell wall-associated NlpC family hydrolase